MPEPAERLAIAQVTPYAWESGHEVNRAIARVAERLTARGHRVAILAPSTSPDAVRRTARLLRDASGDGAALLGASGGADEAGGAPVLAIGEQLGPFTTGRGRALPVDVTRAIERAFERVGFDLCHVHDPWAPSVASAALRSSPALNVGTFHAPTERVVASQLARRLVQLVFGRLDARIASFEATAELMRRLVGGEYRTVLPAADPVRRTQRPAGAPLRIAAVDVEERGALRLFLRALRRLPEELAWEAVVFSRTGAIPTL
ncbi:MAG TPA: glycosyltransferase family 4 protein, partial [Solirubrobacteraceae bacterium]|nr:glycosyltransferase family 4 protein [Solirubrobacteraceae bacterium]